MKFQKDRYSPQTTSERLPFRNEMLLDIALAAFDGHI